MGLFSGKAKKEIYAAELANRFENVEILQYLLCDLYDSSKDSPWLTNTTGYYDNRRRTVVVGTHGVAVFNCAIGQLQDVDEAMRRARKAATYAVLTDKTLQRAKEFRENAYEAIDSLNGIEQIGFNYTSYGFRPLSEYCDQNRAVLLNTDQTLLVWAEVLLSKLESAYPGLSFSSSAQLLELDRSVERYVAFTYTTPALNWKTWF